MSPEMIATEGHKKAVSRFPPMILIFGSPRSGTTWLGKLFDSHPDVFYLHEPDSILVDREIPFQVGEDELEKYIAPASEYLLRLLEIRNIKVTGSLPVFRKQYRNTLLQLARTGYVYTSKIVGRGVDSERIHNINVPDCYGGSKKVNCRNVIKSVNSLNRATLFSRVNPDARVLHLIRHPCGYVASLLRGFRLNLLQGKSFMPAISRMPEAKQRGFTLNYLEGLAIEEQLACLWMVQNEKTMKELQGNKNYKLVVYEDLCLDPVTVTRELFSFSGLNWNAQSEKFIQDCLNADNGGKGYFQIIRNPAKAASRWKDELDRNQVSRVIDFVSDSAPWRIINDSDANLRDMK
jgi:hypothetical protein